MEKAGPSSRKIARIEKDSKEESRSDEHPLLNSLVLANLFNVVKFDVRQFSTFRLVCKTWKDVSLPVWRKNVQLELYEDDDGDNVLTDVDYMTLLDSPEDSHRLKKFPFRKYKIQHWDLNLEDEVLLQFWTKVGPLMRHLSLDSCTFEGVDDFKKIVFELTPNLDSLRLYENKFFGERPSGKVIRLDPTKRMHLKPESVQANMKKLHVQLEPLAYSDDDDEENYGMNDNYSNYILPTTWMELLAHFPNIEEMRLQSLTNESGEASQELVECVKSMEIIRDNLGSEYFAKLQQLGVAEAMGTGGSFPREILASLKQLQLPLRGLCVDVCMNTEELIFKDLLQVHAETLERLYVIKGNGVSYPNFPFGLHLPNLTNLDVGSGIITNLNFLKQTPSLKAITVGVCTGVFQPPLRFSQQSCVVIANTNFNELTDLVLPAMKTLNLENQLCTGEQIEKLAKIMPNLINLHVGLGNDGFQMVCEVWKKLNELEIHPFQVDEKHLLGMKTRRSHYHYPNLTDLHDLKKFRMGYFRDTTFKMGLSNASILHGILRLNHLDEIVAYLSPEVEDEVCNQLLLKFPRCKRTLYKKQMRTAN